MTNIRTRTATAALALAASALLGAGSVALAAPATAAPAVVHTAAPSVGELQAKLQLVLNTGAGRGARAAELEGGEADLATIDKITGVISSVPSFAWYVTGPVNVSGDTLTANLQTTVSGYAPFPLIEVSWRQVGGSWKLTSESVCTVGYYASVSC
ncbi:hypothetical protein [Nocardia harenae]|uniref:hypothetical protein n=1 Tax=Nocardia harenae TaxID=358707 RepID=UPI00082D0A27|nr:hypothetical protein [Nocardia harenae]